MSFPKNRNETSGTTDFRVHQDGENGKTIASLIFQRLNERPDPGQRTKVWLAKEAGLPVATVADALNRGPVKVDAALRIAAVLDMSLEEIMLGATGSPPPVTTNENPLLPVPIIDACAAAGAGAANDHPRTIGEMQFPARDLRRFGSYHNLRLIRAKGDSMHPEIRDDDLVMFDVGNTDFRNGIMILNRDGLLVIKRLEMIGRSKARLLSDNKAYAPEDVDLANEQLAIVGRVVWAGKAY